MPQKIKILQLRKTDEYIAKELDALKGRKYKLLTTSDWTQYVDAGLDRKNVLQWRFWRNKVRSTVIDDPSIILELEKQIIELEENKPAIIKKTTPTKFILNDFDYSSLENFKKSCILIIHECIPVSKDKRFVKLNKANTINDAFDVFLNEI